MYLGILEHRVYVEIKAQSHHLRFSFVLIIESIKKALMGRTKGSHIIGQAY